MPNTSLQHYLEQLHAEFMSINGGVVADYIPELSKVDPDLFGIAIVTVDGHVYQVGDSRHPFSIQSISKAFTYGIALEDSGNDEVASRLDVEPSGEAFNSISLERETGRPRNPMINAGAIVATSLVKGDDGDSKLERILDKLGKYAGRELEVDDAIYQSEKTTGHRNRAIAHLLRNYDILHNNPEEPLDAYFRQCSILVTARDLAVMGATLANDGVNPITGVRAVDCGKVQQILSVMATCGMYDYSGNWIYNVGMPAKSGVGGGVVAVLPGQLGLAVFSPRLDAKGNSVRGIAVCETLSRNFGLHMLRVTCTTTASVIRTTYTGSEVRSKLNRDVRSTAILDEAGDAIYVVELTGELMFVSAEIVANAVSERMDNKKYLILDLGRVSSVDQSAANLLATLCESLIADGNQMALTGLENHYAFEKYLDRRFKSSDLPILDYEEIDEALEFFEDALLQAHHHTAHGYLEVPLAEQSLCSNFTPEEMEKLRSLLTEQVFEAGSTICTEGEPADKLFFLVSGQVSVSIKLDHKRRHRLSAFSAGLAFGESALFEGHSRTADIVADTDVKVLSLGPGDLDTLTDPLASRIMIKLLRNLADLTLARLGQANREIRVLSS
jgi:glutaminase